MEDRFVVKNNSGNILMLPKNRITLAIGASIDLARRLNKTFNEIKRDAEITRELTNKNLILEDEFDSSIESGMDKKLDTLIGLMQLSGSASPSVSIDLEAIEKMLQEKVDLMAKKMNISNKDVDEDEDEDDEEESMREKAFMELMKKDKGKGSNLDTFGGKSKEIDSDDHSDFIDF